MHEHLRWRIEISKNSLHSSWWWLAIKGKMSPEYTFTVQCLIEIFLAGSSYQIPKPRGKQVAELFYPETDRIQFPKHAGKHNLKPNSQLTTLHVIPSWISSLGGNCNVCRKVEIASMNDEDLTPKTFVMRYADRSLAMFKAICNFILTLQSSSVNFEFRMLAQ
jgi:hypothetical protein